MSNQSQSLTTVDKVNLLLGSVPMAFNCFGGSKNNNPLRYTLEVIETKPYTMEVSFISAKTVNDKKVGVVTPIIKLIAQNESIKVEVVNDLPLTSKEVFKANIIHNDDTTAYPFTSHREVAQLLALPHWINNAESYVSANTTAPMWLVIATLIQKTTKVDATELEKQHSTRPFTVEQFNESLKESAAKLPKNPQLQAAIKRLDAQLATVDVKAVEQAKTK